MEFSCQKCRLMFSAPRYNRDPYCPECMEQSFNGSYWRDEYSAEQNNYINNLVDRAVLHPKLAEIRRALEEGQGRICAICGRTDERLYIDHDHKTGLVRGLLCPKCNFGIANFEDDSTILVSAARYLNNNYSHHAKVFYPHRDNNWRKIER